MEFGDRERLDFLFAKTCHICKKEIRKDQIAVRDHSHQTGRYRGKAHQSCNLNYKNKFDIPLFAHNNFRYDNHFLITYIFNAIPGETKVISQTMETYIAVYKNIIDSRVRFVFLDSFKFLNASLDTLVSLLDEKRDFNMLEKHYDVGNLNLLKQKSFFPYEYVDSILKLAEKTLPKKEEFYSSLTGENISDENYEHARKVWDTFLPKKNLREYTYFYNKLDVILLAIVFEKFRETCMREFGLDPTHYVSLPGFSFDAMLKMTGVRIELLTDIDKLLFCEKAIRGGITEVIKRKARCNNKYVSETYDERREDSYIMCFDVNSMYASVMREKLPISDYQFLRRSDIKNFDVFSVSDDSEMGYMLECDLEYPENLHSFFAQMPLFATHQVPPNGKFEKLMRTLENKKKYVVHYKNLQQAIRLGVQVGKIYRILSFKQEAWLKPYIEKNNYLRSVTSNEFEKNLYKLMVNVIFGKFIENVRKRNNIKICNDWSKPRIGCEALIAKPFFKRLVVFEENLVAIEMQKLEILMNRPIILGACILDLSKVILNCFYYDFLLKHYSQNKCQILYTDTDSLYVKFKGQNIYEIMKENLSFFDTSNYRDDNIFSMPRVNKQKLGLMKDEFPNEIITDFIALRPKMYAIKLYRGSRVEKKRCKGIKKSVVDKEIRFEDYLKCLKESCILKKTQNCIRSKKHELFTISETKIALSPNDDKRYGLPNSINTLPYGYKM